VLISPGTKPTPFVFFKKNREDILSRDVNWNIPGLSEFTFIRTYSRKKENGKLETWNECVIRVIEGMFSIIKTHAKINHLPWDEKKAQSLAIEAADRMFRFKWLPPGRGLWIMGTPFMWEKGGAALNNCGFVSTDLLGSSKDETYLPFKFLMDMSMLGVGVGFDTAGAGNVTVQGYSDEQEVHVTEDSREGWVDLVGKVILNLIFGGPEVIPDVSKIRGPGLPIRGFGGVSSGPGPLLECVRGVKAILNGRVGQNLTSTDIVDVQNLIGKCVVSGNVRRTAEIAFSEPEDESFFTMKNWSLHPVEMGSQAPPELKEENESDFDDYNNNIWNTQNGVTKRIVEKYKDRPWAFKFGGWRWASNNSMFARVGQDYKKYEPSIKEAGEPGFAWLDLMRRFGRMKDPENNKDYRVKGGNPCLEQSLESYELCCLVETFPAYHEDYWDYQRTLKFAYLYAKAVTLVGTHFDRTNAVIIRNRRIGCSMSGVADAIAKFGRTKYMQEFCDKGYAYINYLDAKYSEWMGVPQSIKKTSIKPSGTTSLVAGAFGPGLHFPKMKSGYRLVRVASNSELVPILEAANYKVEPSVTDPLRTVVVYFPWLTPEGTITEEGATIWEKFKIAADLQYWWADNQTSCTVEFTKEEADRGEISRCLEAFDGQLKGISLLPKTEGVYMQMPYTSAPRSEVEAYVDSLLPLDFSSLMVEGEDADANKFCDSSGCQL
jgi:ribonucleoside-triphosphate reductase